jgi:hypothetical protein
MSRTLMVGGAWLAERSGILGMPALGSPNAPARRVLGSDGLAATYPSMSYVPYVYSITGLEQDGTGISEDVVNTVQLETGGDYKFKLSWTPLSAGSTGTLTFRANWIDKFYFALVFYSNGQVGFTNENDGSFIDLARTYRPVDQTHPAKFTLTVSNQGTTFKLRDNAAPGSPIILRCTYTLTQPPLPRCLLVGHNTHAGTKAVWDYVKGTPTK